MIAFYVVMSFAVAVMALGVSVSLRREARQCTGGLRLFALVLFTAAALTGAGALVFGSALMLFGSERGETVTVTAMRAVKTTQTAPRSETEACCGEHPGKQFWIWGYDPAVDSGLAIGDKIDVAVDRVGTWVFSIHAFWPACRHTEPGAP